jgi:hypothetical protein
MAPKSTAGVERLFAAPAGRPRPQTKGGSMSKLIIALTAVLTLGLPVGIATADDPKPQPDATLALTEGSVAAGIGFSWGGGTLTYQGKDYPVSVEGLTVGSVGIAEAKATGKVFGLKNLADFDGVYTAAKLGATVGGGGDMTTMKNAKNVTIELNAITEGVKFTAGPGGVKLKLKQ